MITVDWYHLWVQANVACAIMFIKEYYGDYIVSATCVRSHDYRAVRYLSALNNK